METIRKIIKTPLFTVILISLIGCVLFYIHSSRLNSWFVDDAGISFSYSRSLADGYGLVAQPGAAPVEGYSNPTWVFLFALVKLLGFDILTSAKIIALVFSCGTIFLAALICSHITQKTLLTLLGVTWIALQPALVIWFVSGLENSLYAFLILLLLWLSLKKPTGRLAVISGIVAALVALTRPEGFAFFLIYLLVNRKQWKPFLLSFVLLFGAYFCLRWIYFGYPLPNTFYMKVGGGFQIKQLFSQVYYNLRLLGNGILGKTGFWIGLVLLPLLFIASLWKKKIDKTIAVLLISSVLALGVYLLLPSDWMGELRFASPFLTIFPLLLAALIDQGLKSIPPAKKRTVTVAAWLLLAACLGMIYKTDYLPRFEKFVREPTVDLASVQASAQGYTRLAALLGLEQYSVLQADVGGALWLDKYQVIDLGGLVDANIARTLGRDPSALYAYLFDEVQPDMIELHGKWAMRANLQGDARFAEEYRPLYSSIDTSRTTEDGEPVLDGFFVRKELITSEEQFEQLVNLTNE